MVVVAALFTAAASSAAAQTATVNAAWSASSGPDVAGYIIEYGTEPNVYTQSIDVGNVTTYPLTVNIGQTYYFVVKAYNSGGASPRSARASGGVFTDRPITI